MVTTEGYPAPLGLRPLGSFLTQGVALGYPISPLWGWLQNIIFLDLYRWIFDSGNFVEAAPLADRSSLIDLTLHPSSGHSVA